MLAVVPFVDACRSGSGLPRFHLSSMPLGAHLMELVPVANTEGVYQANIAATWRDSHWTRIPRTASVVGVVGSIKRHSQKKKTILFLGGSRSMLGFTVEIAIEPHLGLILLLRPQFLGCFKMRGRVKDILVGWVEIRERVKLLEVFAAALRNACGIRK